MKTSKDNKHTGEKPDRKPSQPPSVMPVGRMIGKINEVRSIESAEKQQKLIWAAIFRFLAISGAGIGLVLFYFHPER